MFGVAFRSGGTGGGGGESRLPASNVDDVEKSKKKENEEKAMCVLAPLLESGVSHAGGWNEERNKKDSVKNVKKKYKRNFKK